MVVDHLYQHYHLHLLSTSTTQQNDSPEYRFQLFMDICTIISMSLVSFCIIFLSIVIPSLAYILYIFPCLQKCFQRPSRKKQKSSPKPKETTTLLITTVSQNSNKKKQTVISNSSANGTPLVHFCILMLLCFDLLYCISMLNMLIGRHFDIQYNSEDQFIYNYFMFFASLSESLFITCGLWTLFISISILWSVKQILKSFREKQLQSILQKSKQQALEIAPTVQVYNISHYQQQQQQQLQKQASNSETFFPGSIVPLSPVSAVSTVAATTPSLQVASTLSTPISPFPSSAKKSPRKKKVAISTTSTSVNTTDDPSSAITSVNEEFAEGFLKMKEHFSMSPKSVIQSHKQQHMKQLQEERLKVKQEEIVRYEAKKKRRQFFFLWYWCKHHVFQLSFHFVAWTAVILLTLFSVMINDYFNIMPQNAKNSFFQVFFHQLIITLCYIVIESVAILLRIIIMRYIDKVYDKAVIGFDKSYKKQKNRTFRQLTFYGIPFLLTGSWIILQRVLYIINLIILASQYGVADFWKHYDASPLYYPITVMQSIGRVIYPLRPVLDCSVFIFISKWFCTSVKDCLCFAWISKEEREQVKEKKKKTQSQHLQPFSTTTTHTTTTVMPNEEDSQEEEEEDEEEEYEQRSTVSGSEYGDGSTGEYYHITSGGENNMKTPITTNYAQYYWQQHQQSKQ